MRITQESMNRRLLGDLDRQLNRVDRATREMSSQRKLLRPSDDPVGAQRAVLTRTELSSIDQYQVNISQARGFLNTTDDALTEMMDILHRARELTVQGASDEKGDDARKNIALEIDQLVSALKQAGNTSYGGVHVFAGTLTNSPPYDTTSSPPVDTYAGNDGIIAREIGPGISVQLNTLVDDGTPPLLGSGVPGDGGLIDTLRRISEHLKSGTVADRNALRTTDLQALEGNLDAFNKARAVVGATSNRLDAADARLAAAETAATELLSDTEDVDLAEATLELSTAQSVYEAALKSGALIIQRSLLDFLS
ncbi:MAG TPA: flagellar hook-associated protein FlgL [Capillimicrobium sp.]|nr:flagellar hook-associated protein FlgL [Capillimicrobium sp.]